MATVPIDLTAFLAEHRDSREYRRGLAVKLTYQGYTCEMIADLLDVTPGFISQAKKAYTTQGVAGFKLKYQGSQPFLSADERAVVLSWLTNQTDWSVERLKHYLEATYQVSFQSDQSYYELLAAAKITYKKTQATNPKYNPELVAAKKKILKR